MIEKEEDLVCSMNHKLPIYMVVYDKSIEKKKTFMQRMYGQFRIQSQQCNEFQKVAQLIEENQKKKVESVEQAIMMNINSINELYKTFHQLKSYIIQQLDQFIGNTDEWIKCLQQIGQEYVNYSFFEELDNLINQVKIGEFDYKPLFDQINTINSSWNQKINKKLNEFKSFELANKCQQLLTNLESINQQKDLMKQINIIQDQQQIENVILKQTDVEFKLIDDLNKQFQFCYGIVFNNIGSIMISHDYRDILVWNFTQGRLKLSNRFQVHQHQIKCLVYSKNELLYFWFLRQINHKLEIFQQQ